MNLATIIGTHPADTPALRVGAETVTYSELRAGVGALRGGLIAQGLKPDDRVVLVMTSGRQFIDSYFAVLGAGAVAVPLNPQSPTAELVREIAAVRPTMLITGPMGTAVLAGQLDSIIGLTVVAPESAGFRGAVPFETVAAGTPGPIVERADSDLAALMFTSGTAGSPKAAMLTHGNLRSNLEQMQALGEGQLRSTDVVLGIPPLFHIYGLNGTLGVTLSAGACLVPVDRFDPSTTVATIASAKVTILAGAPPVYDALVSLPADAATREQMASLRRAVSGASKLDPATARAFVDRFGIPVSEGYGLTEASPVVTSAVSLTPRAGTIGVPLPGVLVRLVDESGGDALVDDAGEIWVKGPNVFPGYWEDPEATARVLTADGWLKTGDIAVAEATGELTIVDRAKDLIIVSGFNVYPAEVEEVLAAHPDVVEAAVVGVPHPHSGETVRAFVVARPGAVIEADALIAFSMRQLARYKCPTSVEVVTELPKGLQGKVLRRSLT
jgi:long-chain acyl-CoA synthetase